MRSLAKLQPWALMLLRVVLGTAMVYNSWEKVYPPHGLLHGNLLASVEHFNAFVATLGVPRWLGYFSTCTEFLGGLCLLLGLLTRFWALLITINMAFAIVLVNRHHGYPGSEYSLALLVMALLLMTTGSGALALDRRFGIA
jgi:putative oxidoreductase